MTAQIGDLIWIDGKRHSLCVLPLSVVFNAMPKRPHFQSRTTANWRGYQASWRIEAEWLWLIGLSGKLVEPRHTDQNPRAEAKADWLEAIAWIESFEQNERGARLSRPVGSWRSQLFVEEYNGEADERAVRDVTLAQLLDSSKIPVRADWYSGLLRVPMGDVLNYVHGGFLSVTEFDLILEIDRGAVRRRWMLDHRPGFTEEKRRREAFVADVAEARRSILAAKFLVEHCDASVFRSALQNPRQSMTSLLPHPAAALGRDDADDALRQAIAKDYGYPLQAALFASLHHFFLVAFLERAGGETMAPADLAAKEAYVAAFKSFEAARLAVGGAMSFRKALADAGMLAGKLPLVAFCRLDRSTFDHLDGDLGEIWLELFQDDFDRSAEIFKQMSVPEVDAELIAWSESKIRSAEALIGAGEFLALGVAFAIIYEAAEDV